LILSWKIHTGDCRKWLGLLDGSSIDAVVTDPPYELGFMGKKWDSTGIAYQQMVWEEVLRVLKPGGHLLAFGGTRTYHRLACAIEDVGFEIRDSIHWIYGSGFPKSLDVSKAFDREAGLLSPESVGFTVAGYGHNEKLLTTAPSAGYVKPSPATEAAKQWEGWGTALKPAHEPIVLARKPFSGTVAANVQEYRTGGLNVDACRIDLDPKAKQMLRIAKQRTNKRSGKLHHDPGGDSEERETLNEPIETYKKSGRWPTNVVLSPEAAAELDEQTGELPSGSHSLLHKQGRKDATMPDRFLTGTPKGYQKKADTGGASRYFPVFKYEAKASRGEREFGLADDDRNDHPTVKPVALVQWLCRLITPPGGTVLDPFLGSGSTGIAAIREGFDFIGIELSPEYVELATRRIEEDAPLFNRQGERENVKKRTSSSCND
jgi:site-specific DNA-methyltransferase (adenine-specific)